MSARNKYNYSTVMSRVYNKSRSHLGSQPVVMRHDSHSSVRIGAKQTNSNVSSGVFSELPTVLDGFEPVNIRESVPKLSRVVKPKKTLKSLNTDRKPSLAHSKPNKGVNKISGASESVPTVLYSDVNCSSKHVKKFYTSRDNRTLKELKDEISAYREEEKLMRIRARLYKTCGVVLDDVPTVRQDQAVQVTQLDQNQDVMDDTSSRLLQRPSDERLGGLAAGPRLPAGGRGPVAHGGAHVRGGHAAARLAALRRGLSAAAAAAALRQPLQPALAQLLRSNEPYKSAGSPVLDQQMKTTAPLYPVDRYLIKSNNNIEMANIIQDEEWRSEPTLRPEDEIILRKLHEMLQTTTNDLKILSEELVKDRASDVRVKCLPTPLDEEFNEKVHIEEIVNAKFHGYKIVDHTQTLTTSAPKIKEILKDIVSNTNIHTPKLTSAGVQGNVGKPKTVNASILKRTTNKTDLLSETSKTPYVSDKVQSKYNKLTLPPQRQSVIYSQFKHVQTEEKEDSPRKIFSVQQMPSINIRSALREQRVIQLDIKPDRERNVQFSGNKNNTAFIDVKHNIYMPSNDITINKDKVDPNDLEKNKHCENNKQIRKVSKMSTCESSESTGNLSSENKFKRKPVTSNMASPKPVTVTNIRKNRNTQKENSTTRRHLSIDEWKTRLGNVYGRSKKKKPEVSMRILDKTLVKKKSNIKYNEKCIRNNAEYIPYSKLTLGGARVSDIEREISNEENKSDIPLSPILDRILCHENSTIVSPKVKGSSKILTTSDENLLEEVLDIGKKVENSISNSFKNNIEADNKLVNDFDKDKNVNDNISDNVSYDDDFEDDKADKTRDSADTISASELSEILDNSSVRGNEKLTETKKQQVKLHIHDNETFNKTLNLSFKDEIDIFEYLHSIETQDIATQSNTTQKISLKETQTSPRNENINTPSINYNLEPPIDPKGEIDKLFNIEKDLIKKIILEEYGDLLIEGVSKPSTSTTANNLQENRDKNICVLPKNTQTSPGRVKTVMTSPTRTKTRTTSPFPSNLFVNRETSPFVTVTNEENASHKDPEDLGISINLSSPRFSLRLPQTSRDVLSNIDWYSQKSGEKFKKGFIKELSSRSSSADLEVSSSELSSLGEVKLKLRRNNKNRLTTTSESSTTSTLSKTNEDVLSEGILPLKSEGEVSMGQHKSEGEIKQNQTYCIEN